tara:strand:+ start:1249 stop:1659 length:411 start_codon:yes stop_codon:yes gene_type:complete
MIEEVITILTKRYRLSNTERMEFARRKKSKGKKVITNKELRLISRKLTRVLKQQIRKQGHVDTGKMLKTIEAIATLGGNSELVVKINAVEYWKYVNGIFNVLANAMKTRAWAKVVKEFNGLNRGADKKNKIGNKHF